MKSGKESAHMDAQLAKEIADLMAQTLVQYKPAKHVLLMKWLTVIGIVALVSGWATLNTVVARWNAIPVLQARTEQANADISGIREKVSSHESAQAVEWVQITMKLEAINEKQTDQKKTLAEIGQKLDRLSTRSSIEPRP